jgi:hypothetical protein
LRRFVRWPTLLVLIALIIVAIVPAALSIRHATGAYASGGAKITLSSSTGQPGTTIQVSGKGFTPGQSVSLYLGSASGTLLTSVTTDASGNLPLTNITVPDQPGGANSITAVEGKVVAQAAFSILPLISLSKTILYSTEVVTLTSKGFAANAGVQLYFDTISGQSDRYFDSNNNGDATIQFTVPELSLAAGHHVLIAVGNSSSIPLMAQENITIWPYIYPMVGQPGINENMSGAGFSANEAVNIYWGNATGQLLGSTTASSSGNLGFSFTIPAGLSAGLYPVTLVRTQHKPQFITRYLRINPLNLTLTPGGIHSGQQVKVNMDGFLASEYLTLSWNANGGVLLTGFTTDQRGSVNSTFTPPYALPGTYTVTASDNSGLQATSTLSIGPGVSASTGVPGTTVTISGGGFAANEILNVYLQTPKNGEVTATTNAIGAFEVNLPLPSSYNPSTHYYIYAVSTTSTEHAVAPFKFSIPTFAACNISYMCGELPYGQTVYFYGDQFATNETVDIIWNYQQPGQFLLAKAQCFFNGFSLGKSIPGIPGQGAVTIAAIGETSHLVVTTTLIIDAAISDNLYNASAGASVNVNGGGFGAVDTITLSLSGKTVATTTSASDGTFATTFLVPTISGAGNLTLTATDTTANITASLPFFYTPIITVSPNVVQNGNSVTVTGKHFSANTQIEVFGNSYFYVTANANGSFSTTVVLSGYQPGSYNFTVEDMSSYIQVSAPFVVQ